ncbi:MAG TPA: hypothetical protein VN493_16555 [Thermoanaerobaculia bacterium]|nr:hypothetical protein [Thermoanaerobaculia bacterium]
MMSAENVALLVGLFAVPALLLALGHRLRRRTPLWRRVFWGGVAGHSIAILAMMAVTMFPPVAWEGGLHARDVAVHWSIVLGGIAGGAVAAALPARKRHGMMK